MSLPHYIVAHPGPTKLEVGEVVKEPRVAQTLRARGAVLLPMDLELMHDLRLGGFIRRDWCVNRSPAWFDRGAGQGGAPTALQVRAGASYLHWAAEVHSTGGVAAGHLRLWCDPSEGLMLNSGLTNLSPPMSFTFEDDDSIVLQGKATFNGARDGLVALGLWGVCSNARVSWMAVSNTESDV